MEPELNIVTSYQAGQSSSISPWAGEPSQVSPISSLVEPPSSLAGDLQVDRFLADDQCLDGYF